MKKPLFAIVIFLNSFELLSQVEGLKDKYDRIPTTDLDSEFVLAITNKFNLLVKQGVDSVMLYYKVVLNNNYAIILYKGERQKGSIAFYEYVPHLSRLGSETLESKVLDSTSIFEIYSIFKNPEARNKDIDTNIIGAHLDPVYVKFYFGKTKETLGGFRQKIGQKMNHEFQNAYSTEWSRIMNREKKLFENANQ